MDHISNINSLLQNDFYKFSMMSAVLHNYPAVLVRYELRWRNWEQMKLRIPLEDFVGRLKKELDHLCTLKFTKDELNYLSTFPYFKPDFIEYLRLFQSNRSYIRCKVENDEIKVTIKGPWVSTILFEVPVLAIISQLYTENGPNSHKEWLLEGHKRLHNKFSALKTNLHKDQKFLFADFGTRRRADIEWHDKIINFVLNDYPQYLAGTSNVYLAMKYGIKPIGTMAHEWIQAHQQLGCRLIDSQKMALQVWANEYRGELGIALSDTITFDAFLADFDRYFALLFDGCRHDSGNPIDWCKKLIAHYKKLRICSRSKTAVFSDGLTFESAVELYNLFSPSIKTSFGIGTYFTNDVGFMPPQIVIKMVECNDEPVAKISDSVGKGMCEDKEYLVEIKKMIDKKINK
jgi:nicotinate phosphoribosyltransferase